MKTKEKRNSERRVDVEKQKKNETAKGVHVRFDPDTGFKIPAEIEQYIARAVLSASLAYDTHVYHFDGSSSRFQRVF